MSIEERYTLTSVRIVLPANAVEFQWNHEIVRDGDVINSSIHGGAYPRTDDGQPIFTGTGNPEVPALQTLFNAVDTAMIQLAEDRRIALEQLDTRVQELEYALEQANERATTAQQQLDFLQGGEDEHFTE